MSDAPIRIAFRVEGPMWNAYIAQRATMEGATLMGSMPIRVAIERQDLADRFKRLMLAVFEHAGADLGITVESYEANRAPEHERSGNA